MAEPFRRADVGFQGGQVLSVRVSQEDYEKLRGSLSNERSERWHELKTADSDIDAALEQVKASGLRLIDEQPRIGIRGSRVAFVHPKSTGGVLTELVEPAH